MNSDRTLGIAPAGRAGSRDFARYLRNFLLATAFMAFAVAAINFVVDPFNRNGVFDLGLDKDKVSFVINQRLFKMLEFSRAPTSKIIFGDSRSRTIDVDVMEGMGHTGWYNFSFGGSNLWETLAIIRLVEDLADLETVVIGVSYGRFDNRDGANVLDQVTTLIDSDLAYYTSLYVLKASFANLYNKFTGRTLRSARPPQAPEEWWQFQLRAARARLEIYQEDEDLKRELAEAVRGLRQRGIEVIILIPPSNAEARDIYSELTPEEFAEFKAFLYSLGGVVDFDIDSSFTNESEKFSDPIHIDKEHLPEIISNIFEPGGDISVHVD